MPGLNVCKKIVRRQLDNIEMPNSIDVVASLGVGNKIVN